MMGYRFISFVDPYTEDDFCTRGELDRTFLAEVAAQPGGPIVVLQHNPMKPIAHTEYPYLLTNRSKVMADYSNAGVLLSISGHFHPGQELHTVGGVRYFTAPASGSSMTALKTQRGSSLSTALTTWSWTSMFRRHKDAQGSGNRDTMIDADFHFPPLELKP